MNTDIKEALDTIVVCDEPVGVMVSGGADSALLLYFILSRYKSKVHVFSTSPGPRLEIDPTYSLKVVRACMSLTGNYNVEHHINYTESWAGSAIFRLPEQYFREGRIKYIFTGITKNPPLEVSNEWPSQGNIPTERRDPSERRDPHCHSEDGKVYPWTNLDKSDLASIYKEHNLIEPLFTQTRSCVDTTVGMEHCGTCWWCRERIWAYGRL